MGITLIMLGTLTMLAGFVLVLLPQKASIKDKLDDFKSPEEQTSQSVQTDVETNIQELINLIKLAAADGVITGNEYDLIYNRAFELEISNNLVSKLLNDEMILKKSDPETRLIDKKKEMGNLFEGYVASKFNKEFVTLRNWAGDKYYKGIYAKSTKDPDLLLYLKIRDVEENFAVECKYKSYYYQDGIEWARDKQIDEYRRFESESKMPVFIAIGIGGTADGPLDLFMIPLKFINHNFLTKKFLMKYRKNIKDKYFFFDHLNQTLN